MTSRLILFLTLLGALRAAGADTRPTTAKPGTAAVAPAPANASVLTPTANADAFRLIGDRNIFNPNRTGRITRTEEAAPKLDVISLVGTMDYEKGVFAFFDGSDAAFRKAVHVGDTVGPLKITQITGNTVQVERDGKPLTLHVADQLRRPDGGDWGFVPGQVAQAEAAQASATRAAEANAAPTIPSDASDIVRRMMEQRQKQLKQ